MNANESQPDRPPLEWLAAYADGELDPAARQAVEEWLQIDAEAREQLEAQNALSPTNEIFWRSQAARLPGEPQWQLAVGNIRQELEKTLVPAVAAPTRSKSRAWRLTRAMAVITTVAAAVLLVLVLNPHNQPSPPLTETVNVEDDADSIFRVATAEEVEIISLPESARPLLVIGDDPLRGTELKPASFEDVDIRGISPNARGDFPELYMTPHGVSGPMVWTVPTE